jgi:hypothetical protein
MRPAVARANHREERPALVGAKRSARADAAGNEPGGTEPVVYAYFWMVRFL